MMRVRERGFGSGGRYRRGSGTETNAILYLDDAGRMRKQTRLNFDSTAHPPERLRVGIRLSSAGSPATVLVDEVWRTESELSP